MEILIPLLWVGMAFLCAHQAAKKGMSGALYFVFGLFVWPLALISIHINAGNQKKCPFCREWIKPDATVCRFCHKDQPSDGSAKGGITGHEFERTSDQQPRRRVQSAAPRTSAEISDDA